MNCDRQGVVLSHRNAPSGRTPPHPPRMLSFSSASVRVAHTRRAVEECLAAVAPASLADCRVLMVHATMGHDFRELAGTAAGLAPHACIVGSASMPSDLLARLPGLHLVYLMLPGVTAPPPRTSACTRSAGSSARR